jgi:hypothetical protein
VVQAILHAYIAAAIIVPLKLDIADIFTVEAWCRRVQDAAAAAAAGSLIGF